MYNAVAVFGYDPYLTLKGRLGQLQTVYHVLQRLLMEMLTCNIKNLFLAGIINLANLGDAEFAEGLC
ncbi:hypothetical protein ES703_87405 [subsurface metagenome]